MAAPAAGPPQMLPSDTPAVRAESTAPPPLQQQPQPQPHKHKSWRKKYYKQRHKFQQLMTTNNTEFENEQRAKRVARRLQEENDQLLDALHEINKAPNLLTKLRYDIRSPVPSAASHPISTSRIDDSVELEDSLAYDSLRSLSNLEAAVPHSRRIDLPTDPLSRKNFEDYFDDESAGYLSPAHEDEYLAAIDAHEPNSFNESTNRIHAPSGPWSARDPTAAAAKNPVSVYNWLKRNNPELLEQNGDKNQSGGAGDGPSGGGTGTGQSAEGGKKERGPKAAPTKVMPKRASVGGAKHEYTNEVLDDDGTVITVTVDATTPSAAAKGRKRAAAEEDGAYRPKGGTGRKKKKMSVGEKSERGSILPGLTATDADAVAD